MNKILIVLIALPLLSALLSLLLPRIGNWLAGLTVLALTVITGWLYLLRPFNNLILFNKFGVVLVLDGFSHLLLITANLTALFIILYAWAYAGKYRNQAWFFALFLALLAGINGVALAGDLIWLFVFLELAALSAYLLVAFGNKREQLEASVKYLLIGEGASLLILIGCGLVHQLTGTFNMSTAAVLLAGGGNHWKTVAALLFIAGFGTKAALMPFHFWLPDAHSAAPAPVSAILSGVIIKALGVYALARVLFNVIGLTPHLAFLLTTLGLISIIFGGLLAVGQWDMKRLMAYSSISQIGYIFLGLGLATPLGILGALFHLFNHALMKSLLFLNAGAVEQIAGTRDLRELGGLRKKLPATATTSLIGTLAISGVPPFNGFWSKLFIIIACVQAGQPWFALAAVIGSLLTMGAFLRVQQYGFFGSLKKELAQITEAPLAMTTAMVSLAALCLLVGLTFPLVISLLINPAVVALSNGLGYGRMIIGGL
ncbi:MAG TPA: proton-conducting transporter membrane subunit [Candidatus Sulfotelmatobacter sp.]|nr:proton-conducting transporter membrane subunit [Candidatus Sulfotelmatobacter sp.]